MKNPHEKILKILHSQSTLDWQDQNNAIFTVGNDDKKYIKGTLYLPEEGLFSLKITNTNYSAPYLKKKIGNAATELNLDFYKTQDNLSFYANLKPGDNIWIFSDGYGHLSPGEIRVLPRGTVFFKVNGSPLLCNPAGSLKVPTTSVFNNYESEKCDPQAITTFYAIFQLQ